MSKEYITKQGLPVEVVLTEGWELRVWSMYERHNSQRMQRWVQKSLKKLHGWLSSWSFNSAFIFESNSMSPSSSSYQPANSLEEKKQLPVEGNLSAAKHKKKCGKIRRALKKDQKAEVIWNLIITRKSAGSFPLTHLWILILKKYFNIVTMQ